MNSSQFSISNYNIKPSITVRYSLLNGFRPLYKQYIEQYNYFCTLTPIFHAIKQFTTIILGDFSVITTLKPLIYALK